MNLVIDDAVEVKQPTKSDPEVKRRELGNWIHGAYAAVLTLARTNPAQRR